MTIEIDFTNKTIKFVQQTNLQDALERIEDFREMCDNFEGWSIIPYDNSYTWGTISTTDNNCYHTISGTEGTNLN